MGAGGIATEDEIDFDTFAGCVRVDLGTDPLLEHLPDLAVWATKAQPSKINQARSIKPAVTDICSKQRNVMTAQNLWNEAGQLLNHAGGHPKPGRLPT